MRTELCDRFGIDYPIFVFTPSEKVAAAVSKAGGLGVLGCVRFNDADDLDAVLNRLSSDGIVPNMSNAVRWSVTQAARRIREEDAASEPAATSTD